MNDFSIFLAGLFSCLFVACLYLQDRHNTALFAALARRDAQTREMIRVLGDLVRGMRFDVADDAGIFEGRDGVVWAVVRVGG